jgi:hypothetical protein
MTTPLSLNELTEQAKALSKTELEGETALMIMLGKCPSGPTTDMNEVTDWTFAFNSTERNASAMLFGHLDTEKFDESEVYAEGSVLERDVIETPLGMTPAEAYKVLQEQHAVEGFQYVSLIRPLDHDEAPLHYRISND